MRSSDMCYFSVLLLLSLLPSFSVVATKVHGNDNCASQASPSNKNAKVHPSNCIVELDVYNFETTLKANEYTCVLFYDHDDEWNTPLHQAFFQSLQQRLQQQRPTHNNNSNTTIGFAQLDIRHHNAIRKMYNIPNEVDAVAEEYFYTRADRLTMIPATFLNFALGSVAWPTKLYLFDRNFNIHQGFDLTVLSTMAPALKLTLLVQWLQDHTTSNSNGTATLLKQSPAILEKEQEAQYHATKNNSFNFDAYFAQERLTVLTEDKSPTDIRLVLETGAKQDNGKKKEKYFVYQRAAYTEFSDTEYFLKSLNGLIDHYLSWAEGYEVTWSEERRARVDEWTNFGTYLEEMNQDLWDIIDHNLQEHSDVDKDLLYRQKMEQDPSFKLKMEIPKHLKEYLHEIVFGYGRSPQLLRLTLQQMMEQMGATVEERLANRHQFTGDEFPMIRRMRDYLQLFLDSLKDDKQSALRYSTVVSELLHLWHNALRQFNRKLSKYYVKQLKKNPRPHGNTFQMKPMHVWDMTDPSQFDLLTDYDEFHRRYTNPGIPVILSNVNMIPHHSNVTLQTLVQQCPHVDVRHSIRVSHKVGAKQAPSEWGGLQGFTLPNSLLTEDRKAKVSIAAAVEPTTTNKKNETKQPREWNGFDDFLEEEGYYFFYGYPDDEEEETKVDEKHASAQKQLEDHLDEDGVDRRISLEQFAILYENIDTLYLHDFGLPETCDRFFFEGSLYDRLQKFQIPSVMASYDLFQRLGKVGYQQAWPSLFVGRKGSNSKLHVDSGATAFFMYLVSGRKRWIVYNRDERAFLYEDLQNPSIFPDVLGIDKSQEANDFLSKRFPLLHLAESAFEIIQEPGQLVYIPPNCPHAVENLEDTVGLAMNFVPKEGIYNHIHDHVIGRHEFDSFSMAMNYLLFESNAHKPVETKDPLYTTFAEYKAQF